MLSFSNLELLLNSQDADLAGVREEIRSVLLLVSELEKQKLVLSEELRKLRENAQLDSRNSHKPPSTDGYKKRKRTAPVSDIAASEGESSEKKSEERGKPGGVLGHPPAYLSQVENPNEQKVLKVEVCTACQNDLSEVPLKGYMCRQAFELKKENLLHVTEYAAEIKICPCCHTKNIGVFPLWLNAPAQYAPNFWSVMAWLHDVHAVSFVRCSEVIGSFTGIYPSPATILNAVRRVSASLLPQKEEIQQEILASPVIHCDETGLNVNGKNVYIHAMTTGEGTWLEVSVSRGWAGMSHLAEYTGIIVHDCWGSYRKATDATHALCNAHLLRELRFLYEVREHEWARKLISRLLALKEEVRLRAEGGETGLAKEEYEVLEHEFLSELSALLTLFPAAERPAGHRGRVGQSKERNLLLRFVNYIDEFLRFLLDFRVPFDNNLAERGLRMLKVVEKVFGCFRTIAGAISQVNIRSFADTCRKKGQKILDSLENALLDAYEAFRLPLKPQI